MIEFLPALIVGSGNIYRRFPIDIYNLTQWKTDIFSQRLNLLPFIRLNYQKLVIFLINVCNNKGSRIPAASVLDGFNGRSNFMRCVNAA